MSRLEVLLALVAHQPLLARLCVASLELFACSLLLAALLRLWRPSSRRLVALLWLVVLLKPVVSLTIGDPIALFHFETAPRAAAVAPPPSPGVGSEGSLAIPHDVVSAAIAASAEPVIASSPTREVAPLSTTRASRPLDPSVWIVGAWLLGAAALLTRRLLVETRLRRMAAAATAAPENFLRRHEALAREAGLRRVPALRITDALESPALFGTLRPLVLLPG
jgi:bla regulator protein blaR1